MNSLKEKAKQYGATDFGYSSRANKKYYVVYNNKIIHFGSPTGSTFLDHDDDLKRRAFRARHRVITNKNGQQVYKVKSSPAFWSWHLLW